jgi:hypothetical protein
MKIVSLEGLTKRIRLVSGMDLEVQHNCDGEMATFAPQASCVDVVGLGWGGILVALAVVVGLGVVGWLLWRRMRNRGDLE